MRSAQVATYPNRQKTCAELFNWPVQSSDSQLVMLSVPCRFVCQAKVRVVVCGALFRRGAAAGSLWRARPCPMELDGGVLLGGVGASSSHAGCDRGGLEAFDDQIDAQ